MDMYKGYSIKKSDYGWYVWGPDGVMYGPFVSDKEAEEFIDAETE